METSEKSEDAEGYAFFADEAREWATLSNPIVQEAINLALVDFKSWQNEIASA